MSEYDMNYALTELKEQHPWLRNYHSKMLQMVCKQVATAARKVVAKKGGKLSYRKQDDFNAFTYNNQSGFKIESSNNRLTLSKIGSSIRIVLHRKLPVNVKQVTVCRRRNWRWYAVVACELLRRMYSTIIRYSKPVGKDVGITKFCHDSDDHVKNNPQFLTKMLKPLMRGHRRVSSRRQIGSSNHRKARYMLARLYERIHNKRKDFLHKTSAYTMPAAMT